MMTYFLFLLALVSVCGYAYAAHVTLSILMQPRPKPILMLPVIGLEQVEQLRRLGGFARLKQDYHLMAYVTQQKMNGEVDYLPKILSVDNQELDPELRSFLFKALNSSRA